MLFEPQIPEIRNHIDHYWIINDIHKVLYGSSKMHAYPGITPDMIIVLDGHYQMDYLGKRYTSNKSLLFSFLHKDIIIDFTNLKKCIIIKFKSRGLSSLLPFLSCRAEDLMRDSVVDVDSVFKVTLKSYENYLIRLSPEQIVATLDEWFLERYNKEREGFVIEMAQEVSPEFHLRTIMDATNYSYSTIERYFKRDTGLTPKKFQSLRRYKRAVRELYTTQNTDWQHYIDKYGYYDQSHFIKEIKRYTSFSPAQLLQTPAFIQVRPEYS